MGGSGSRHQQNNSQDSSSDASTTPSTSKPSKKFAKAGSYLKFSFKRKPTNRTRTGPFRDLIKSWPISDLNLLLAEFEADSQLLKLQNECDTARKSIKLFSEEFQMKIDDFSDLEVKFQETSIKTNRNFLSQRCKNLQVPENSEIFELPAGFLQNFQPEDVNTFLSDYIYTQKWEKDGKILGKLRKEFGCQKKLHDDMVQMFRSDLKKGDLVITVINEEENDENEKKKEKKSIETFEIRCSSAVAASRSRLISTLLSRGGNQQKKLSFSDEIFPLPFAALFLNFLYTDVIDWSLTPSSESSVSSLSQAKAITSGRNPDVQLCRAMQILQMARFFGVEGMVQACEDVIVKTLTVDNAVFAYQWAEENHSSYVSTHAFRILEVHFNRISTTSQLFDLTLKEIVSLVESHFLQCTELELLNACVRWGEHALLRKLEEREPNVVADTCHSISRRGLKKTELSGEELKEILKPLTEKIRKDYAIPPFHQNLTDAYSRGILERSPLDLTICEKTWEINPDVHWLKPSDNSSGPRYYQPYHKELVKWKTLLTSSEATTSSGIFSKFSGKENPESLHGTPSTSSEIPTTFQVEFYNSYPQILDESMFLEAKQRILEMTEKWNVAELPRSFHRNLAVEMITRKTLLELDISPECFNFHVSNGKSAPPDVLPPVSGIYDIF